MAADFVVKIFSCVLLAFSWCRTPVKPLARQTDNAAELPNPRKKKSIILLVNFINSFISYTYGNYHVGVRFP